MPVHIDSRSQQVLLDIKNAENWQKAIFDDDIRQELLSQQN